MKPKLKQVKQVIIIRGFSGSGKTTLAANILAGISSGYMIAADDYPLIRSPERVYQIQHQKAAHNWCFTQFCNALKMGKTPVIVHNTFVREWEYKKYKDTALDAGYSVQIVNTEKTWMANGESTQSDFDIPDSVIRDRQAAWEPVTPKPEYISQSEIAKAMELILSHPNHKPAIIADKDGTITKSVSGDIFARSPEDVRLNSAFVEGFKIIQWVHGAISPPLYVVSNQAGLANNRKSLEFLNAEIAQTDKLLRKEKIIVDNYACAIARQGNKYLGYYFDDNGEMEFLSCDSPHPTYKPDIGLISTTIESFPEYKFFWMIGDNNMTDGGMAKNLQTKYPDRHFIYIPIEFFAIAAKLHNQNV